MFEGRNVHFSTDNKPLCSFSGKLCKLRRLNGYAFCVRHILEDPSAPFRQCAFVVKSSGLKCTSAIPQAENRLYCNAHMQVMGIIPKKERKKKVEPLLMPDTDGNGIHQLEKYSTAALINGYSEDTKSNSKPFSASQLFPELAGKLSVDNQFSTSDMNKVTSVGSNQGARLSEPMETVIDENGKHQLLRSPSRQSGSTPKRSRKPTRKTLSILRKKRLGLLSDEEARARFSSAGCQAYTQHIKFKTFETDLLTAIVDSSDDESIDNVSSMVPVHGRLHHINNLRGKDLKRELLSPLLSSSIASTTAVTSAASACHQCVNGPTINEALLNGNNGNNPKSDLNATQMAGEACSSISERLDSKPAPPLDVNLVSMKQTCMSIFSSQKANRHVVNFSRLYLKHLLKALKENQHNASKLVNQIKHPMPEQPDVAKQTGGKATTPQQSQQQQVIVPHPAHKKCRCIYTGDDETRCTRRAVPFTRHCISHLSSNSEQKLFRRCEYPTVGESQPCSNMVVAIGHGPALCSSHALQASAEQAEQQDGLSTEHCRRKKDKKKSKSLNLLKNGNNNKKKNNAHSVHPIATPQPCITDPMQNSVDSQLTAREARLSDSLTVNGGDDLVSPSVLSMSNSQLPMVDDNDDDDIDDDELDKALDLPLDQADSKLLLDKEIEAVLNGNSFDIFSGKHDDDDLGLTEADAEMLLSGADEAMIDEELKGELPDDITDTILHVESEQQQQQAAAAAAAAFQNRQPLQLMTHMSAPPSHPSTPVLPSSPHIMTGSYGDIPTSLNCSYSKNDYMHSMGMPSPLYSHHTIPPPPQYPGPSSSKVLPPVNHLSHSQHSNHMGFMHEQSGYPQHMMHHKLSSSHPGTSGVSGLMHLNSSYPHSQTSNTALPPSSTLLDHQSALVGSRVSRLPPVSSIPMQAWAPPPADTMYQNGYHNPNDHTMYMHNGVPSSPQYSPSPDHRLMYAPPYNHSNYNRVHGPPHLPPTPQRINMPLK